MDGNENRKKYLDQIRWLTIVFVVIFHVYYFYNNIGIDAMFQGAAQYTGQITFAGIFQYFAYPWFMLLLFVVAGMSARYALKSKTDRQFLHARIDKLLVPSTLGVLAFGWIGGYVIYLQVFVPKMPAGTPGFMGAVIALCSGNGALWFCQVLFAASIILLGVRKLLKRMHITDETICKWIETKFEAGGKYCLLLGLLYLIFWGGSHILNMPVVTAYRNGIYIPAFFAGYYIFSNEKMIENLKGMVYPLLIAGFVSGIFYMVRCYGLLYSDLDVLKRWDVNLYAFLMVLLVLGAGAKFMNYSNKFTDFMNQRSFGIYVFHVPVLLVTNYMLVDCNLPITIVYLIDFVSAFGCSILLYEIIHRIPVLRYWTLGLRRKKK